MKTRILTCLTSALSALAALADAPKTEHKEWEQACGGSTIAVTRVAGEIITVDAYAEHFAEGKQWQCHFKDGEIISAMYRHYTVTRKPAGDDGEFATELNDDRVEVFHLPDHDLSKMEAGLRKELSEIIKIAEP